MFSQFIISLKVTMKSRKKVSISIMSTTLASFLVIFGLVSPVEKASGSGTWSDSQALASSEVSLSSSSVLSSSDGSKLFFAYVEGKNYSQSTNPKLFVSRSQNGGSSWTSTLYKEFAGEPFVSLTGFNSSDNGQHLALTYVSYDAQYNPTANLAMSHDFGATWADSDLNGAAGGNGLLDQASIDSKISADGLVIAMVFQHNQFRGMLVMVSRDGGSTFTSTNLETYAYYHDLAMNGDGTLIGIISRGYRRIANADSQPAFVYFSRDLGRTFSLAEEVSSGANVNINSDPKISIQRTAATGAYLVVISWTQDQIAYTRTSTDSGQNFASRVSTNQSRELSVKISVDGGTFLATASNADVLRSIDKGATWASSPLLTSGSSSNSKLEIIGQKAYFLVVAYPSAQNPIMYVYSSGDLGVTWSAPILLGQGYFDSFSYGDYSNPTLGVALTSDSIHATWQSKPSGGQYQLNLSSLITVSPVPGPPNSNPTSSNPEPTVSSASRPTGVPTTSLAKTGADASQAILLGGTASLLVIAGLVVFGVRTRLNKNVSS
jgi:hypothetical protein